MTLLFPILGELGPAVTLLMIGLFVECKATAAVVLLMLGQSLNAFGSAGFGTNVLDIAPMHSGMCIDA